ncbi:hyaluronan synthase [Pilibacter termitis]|uniref:Hyaluronan synthase n=1 Tax=Pilibacter termitis TaxID=263852 RepID=A0A1T4MY02_9ENTE|nr:glycosyltransferase [Pilibacter termitis]SJZ71538.1 hyaluronan synthase [Pilibacter termitis]
MTSLLSIFLLVYGILALGHILIQLVICHSENRRQHGEKFKSFHQGHTASVSVIVPAYNEEPSILKACIDSICKQKLEELEIIVVDDFSKNREELIEKVYNAYENDERVRILLPKQNKGKRHAQKLGFDRATGEIIVTVDSDTLLKDKNAILKLIQRLVDEKVGAVTGDVQVENKGVNLLTRLISYRYWSAFHQERAAQSRFHVVMCCSGPFSAYRTEIVNKVKDEYVSQYFLGENCTYGDDRHLTNLVLKEGHEVAFHQHATVQTFVPETLGQYVKQQVRWNKSFYREMLWTIKFAHRHHWYMLYDLLMQFILPFMLVVSLFAMVFQTIYYGDVRHFVQYLIVLALIAVLRSLYGIFRTRDLGFLLFVIYGFIHVLVLLPVRFYALCTLKSTRWGTR